MLSAIVCQRGMRDTLAPVSNNTVVGNNFVVWDLAGRRALNNKPYVGVVLAPDAAFMLWYCERWMWQCIVLMADVFLSYAWPNLFYLRIVTRRVLLAALGGNLG